MTQCSVCRENPALFLAVFFCRFVSNIAVVMCAARAATYLTRSSCLAIFVELIMAPSKQLRRGFLRAIRLGEAAGWLDKCSFI